MTSLEHDRLCAEVVTQTGLLIETLAGADRSLTVPTCPEWTLTDLVLHLGGNLSAVEAAVRTGTVDQAETEAGPPGADPSAMDAWLMSAAQRFARTLRAADPNTEAEVWGIVGSAGSWARRGAHDLTIHRADAAGTVGAPFSVAPEVAADALDELLELFSAGDLAEIPGLAELPQRHGGRIHLHATDTPPDLVAEWLIEITPEGFRWWRAHEKAAVALRGPLGDLLRVFYRRLPPSDERIEVRGDADLLNFWLERVSLS